MKKKQITKPSLRARIVRHLSKTNHLLDFYPAMDRYVVCSGSGIVYSGSLKEIAENEGLIKPYEEYREN